MATHWLLRVGIGVGALCLALSSLSTACRGKDCADERIGQKRCVGNRLETCGPNNELLYDSCTGNAGENKYCSAAHKACVAKEVFDAQTVGSSSSAGGGEGGSMMHGSGGMHAGAGGDMAASSSAMSSGSEAASSSAMSSSAATGGGDITMPLNGCDPNALKDYTSNPLPVVMFMLSAISYNPACIKIKKGQPVLFVGGGADFATHPMYGGLIDANNVKTVDSIGPIKPTTSGTEVQFTFPTTGAFGFFCDLHYAAGMKGAVYVVP
jgi:plastocyanin